MDWAGEEAGAQRSAAIVTRDKLVSDGVFIKFFESECIGQNVQE